MCYTSFSVVKWHAEEGGCAHALIYEEMIYAMDAVGVGLVGLLLQTTCWCMRMGDSARGGERVWRRTAGRGYCYIPVIVFKINDHVVVANA